MLVYRWADGVYVKAGLSDFECPFCRRLHVTIDSVRREAHQRTLFLFRHGQSAEHPCAFRLALASVSAEARGVFAAFADSVFLSRQRMWSARPAELRAVTGSWSRQQAEVCMADASTRLRVQSDIASGRALGIRGTPTLVFRDKILLGSPSADSLLALLQPTAH